MPDPAKWFLKFADFGGQGRPWGDGTAMAARAAQNLDPWDTGCGVVPIIGGYAAMSAIRDALETTITDAKASGLPMGERGHVYISGWRFNPQRELGDVFSSWQPGQQPVHDQTALGLVLRLMDAGVRVRIMVWLPTFLQTEGAGRNHVEEHYYLARVVAAEAASLGGADPMGVVALDARTAEGSIAGSHHQKTIVIRGLGDNQVAFCGGVDLAFTRRDAPAIAPAPPGFLRGDWQSEAGRPPWDPPPSWPQDSDTTKYLALRGVVRPDATRSSDLPPTDRAGQDIYGSLPQIWHDQHLELHGPIVHTLEEQFVERWTDTGDVFDLSDDGNFFGGQVIFSSPDAIHDDDIVPLPLPVPIPPAGGGCAVQMWRTIPLRDARTGPPFQRGEFTVMAGVSHAVTTARELIWIFDQYFWSMPLARQLNFELVSNTKLRVIVILPPFADTQPAIIHEARRRALTTLCEGVRAQVGVYDLWHPNGARGIYCHAKVQTYDGGLLVCGSANLNRRSFLCDTELACAVADEAVVNAHQHALWALLFRDVPAAAGQWPSDVADLATPDAGAKFFEAFAVAAADPLAFVRPDPWESAKPQLPNLVVVPRGQPLADAWINHIFDPTSVEPGPLERKVDFRVRAGAALGSRPPRLTEVVSRLELTTTRSGPRSMPNRRQFRLCQPLVESDQHLNDVAR